MTESEKVFYVGVDWGAERHQVCILDAAGAVVGELSVAHQGAAVQALCERLLQLAPAAGIAVAIESPVSPVTEPLLECGLAVYALNPKQLDRFRDRFFPAGAKDDRRDSFVLAASLRTDRPCFRSLEPQEPALLDLRALVRLDQTLKADLRAYANRLRDSLLLSFPQVLELCPAADEAWIWALLELAPAAPAAARLSLARLRSLLRRHHIRRISPEDLYRTLRQPALPLPAATFQRSARQVRSLLPLLGALARQQRENAQAIADCLEQLTLPAAGPDSQGQHRDAAILLSLPGVGTMVAATMLAEASTALRDRDYHALRAYSGVAPITRQSGKSRSVAMRYACSRPVREAVYHWSRSSAIYNPAAKAHYARLRARGHSHGRALRGLADRQLRMLCAMLRRRQLYDPNRCLPAA
ncbi:MAG TPA: IS110 family transposase [Terriglobales bacterium]|nr:IS110 family transposase [Terriglobales bacterium]